MANDVAYARGTRAEFRRAIQVIPSMLAGRRAANDSIRAVLTRAGQAALDVIRRAFMVKARGGTDICGLKWKPLSPKTIAYSRKHPGVPPAPKRAPYAPSWMLTKAQRAQWWAIYGTALARFRGDKSSAAKYAWAEMKRRGAETLIGTYGNTPVEILRSTDVLANSLSPGDDSGSQVFRIGEGSVTVGTSVPYAITHHEGRGHVPQRRLWPEPSKWNGEWWDNIITQVKEGIVDVISAMARGEIE